MTDEPVKTIPFVDANGNQGEPQNNNEPPANNSTEPPINDEPPVRKFFDDEWKTHFADEDVETVKSYKTKATELEPKVKEYETKVSEYEAKVKDLTDKRFANERIAKLNELAEAGEEITESFVAFINKDYNKISDPLKGLAEGLRKEHPDWEEKEIQYELRQVYNLDKIKPELDVNGDPLPLTEEQEELKEISDIKQKRDWENKKKELIAEQDKKRIVKKPTAEEVEKFQKEEKEKSEKWQETVKKVSSQHESIKYEFSKDLPIKINDVAVEIAPVEFKATKEDKANAERYLANPSELWKDLMGDAKTDDERFGRIYQFILKGLTANRAMEENAVAQFTNAYELSVKTDKKVSDTKEGAGRSAAEVGKGKVPYVPIR